MAKRKDRRGREKPEQYAPMTYFMLRSPAWRSLSGASIKVFLELHTRFHGLNNGDMFLSLDEAVVVLRLGKATVLRAFKELEVKGFIRKTKPGSWYCGHAAMWRLTMRRHGKIGVTNEWQNWQPDDPKPKRQRKPYGHRKRARSVTPVLSTPKTFPGSEMDRNRVCISSDLDPIGQALEYYGPPQYRIEAIPVAATVLNWTSYNYHTKGVTRNDCQP